MYRNITLLLMYTLMCKISLGSQDGNFKNNIYLQPVYLIGKNIENYTYFPKTENVVGVGFDVGINCRDTSKSITYFYNNPLYGLGFMFQDLGNSEKLGYEFSVFPYLAFSPLKWINSMKIKTGIGISYFNKTYNDSTNRQDKAIGSHYTWCFQLGLMQNIPVTNNVKITLGLAYLHDSNGHIKLPNFGLNRKAAYISMQYIFGKNSKPEKYRYNKNRSYQKQLYLYLRQGNGYQALGGTTGPVNAERGMVYSFAAGGGVILRNHIKVRSGITYRYYTLQREYSKSLDDPEISPFTFASNVYIPVGCEFILGHFGIDIESGINLKKDFYPYFFEEFEHGSEISYKLRKMIPCRLGLYCYIINTEKDPINNLSIGAHINANYGEADFSEISISYTRIIKKNSNK